MNCTTCHRSSRFLRRAFTLVELLTVIAIVGILGSLCVTGFASLMSTYNLNSAGQEVAAQLNFARQDALAHNCAVQVRFYRLADFRGAVVYRAVQSFRETTDSSGNTTVTPISKTYFLPTPLWMAYSATVTKPSTLFTAASGANTSTGDPANPLPAPFGIQPYTFFRFRPSGQTDLAATSTVSIASETATVVANGLPSNFICIGIDAVNGNVSIYQP